VGTPAERSRGHAGRAGGPVGTLAGRAVPKVGCMIVPGDVEHYCDANTTPAPPWMAALEAETREQLSSAQMLTGHLEGSLLATLAWAASARRVLELGTYSGYGALSLAAGLAEGGRVWTCELDEERAAFARRHIEASPLADRIEIVLGPALESARRLPGPWDLVFVDADKPAYPDYVDALLPKLALRGLMLLDNTLRRGSVIDPPPDDTTARLIADLNARLAGDDQVVATLLPIRDGLTLVRRAG
jgi:caffeoyl-CoA O-methyltransferase